MEGLDLFQLSSHILFLHKQNRKNYEFIDEYATRQVEMYNGQWFYSKDDYHPGIGDSLADQPLSEMDVTEAVEITQIEFEDIWEKACECLDKK